MKVLVDSSFLFTIHSPTDKNHEWALQVGEKPIEQYLIPDIVLAETAYMLRIRIGHAAVFNMLDNLGKLDVMVLEAITKPDVKRARDIMATYSTSDFDLADCCIVAQAERYGVKHVCTFDERDFRQFKPAHCAYLELWPFDL